MLIPKIFLQLWLPVIQRLCEHKMSPVFLKMLFNITNDENGDSRIKEISAVWLNTILKILYTVVIMDECLKYARDLNLSLILAGIRRRQYLRRFKNATG